MVRSGCAHYPTPPSSVDGTMWIALVAVVFIVVVVAVVDVVAVEACLPTR